MPSGLLICFEGGEGAGKTTQAKILADTLAERGMPVVLTREPGGTALGEAVRGILLEALPPVSWKYAESAMKYRLSPTEEFLLFSVARAHLVRTVIKPSLSEGKIVILDRYFYSSYAYQGGGGGVDLEWMRSVTERIVEEAVPDLVVLLDLPPEVGLARPHVGKQRSLQFGDPTPLLTSKRRQGDASVNDRFFAKDTAYHQRLAEAFREMARDDPERFAVIDATKRKDEIAALVLKNVERVLAGR